MWLPSKIETKIKTNSDTIIMSVKVSSFATIIPNNVIKRHRGPDKLLPITVLNKCGGKVKKS